VVHGLVDSVHGFPLGKQFPENPISDILHLGPSAFPKSTHSPRIYSRPGNLKNNSKKAPSLRKSHKNNSETSKIHLFSTTTPKPVILVPKFSESLPLSFCAFI
jgi:hypothetical protein